MATAQAFTMLDVRSTMPNIISNDILNNQEQEFWQTSYWDAVAVRDRRMDGLFLYAVRTTGVYCKPSCPSRRPRPENVVFFRTREAARRAGFRACKRCKPDATSTSNPNTDLVAKVCRYIDAHPDGPATLEALSRAIGLSPFHLQRTFKAVTGITPRAYADSRRLQALKAGLRDGHSVTRSLYDAGYGSSSRLYEGASSKLGMTPARYGKQGSGVAIRYTIAKTPIGRMLLAATGKGVCSVQFGDSDETLESELQAALPRGLDVEIDGQFPAMFSYKMKNYALLDSDGKLHVTGSALRSRGLEKFQRRFLEEMLTLALKGEAKQVPQLYEDYCQKIERAQFPIEMLAKTETLQDTLDAYQQKIAKSARNRSAVYELALKSGRTYQPGDQISYYVTGDGKRVSVYDNCKLATDFNPARRDENIDYYLDKLKSLYKKFAPILVT